MWIGFVGSAVVSLSLLTTAVESPEEPVSARFGIDSLPGRVVDIKAGEFYFKAPDTIPAGLTTFRLEQVGMVVDRLRAGIRGRAAAADKGDATRGAHMLWVVRLEQGKTAADYLRAEQSRIPTPWATHIGGPAFIFPPATTNATVDLEPGNYALVCHIGSAREDRSRSHLLNGMIRALTVVAARGKPASAPEPDVHARITGEGVVEFLTPIIAGRQVIQVRNATARRGEFKFKRVPYGMTGKEALAGKPNGGEGPPVGGLSSVPPGKTVTTTIDFEPGEYIVGTRPSILHETSRAFVVARRR